MHLVALIDGDLRVYPVEADVEVQTDLLSFAAKWWARHVDGKQPPPLDASEGAKAWVRRRFPRDTQPVRKASMLEESLLLDLQEAEHWRDVALEGYEAKRRLVEEAIGNAGGLTGVAGRVTWRGGKRGRTFLTRWFNANRFNQEASQNG
jgi:predicted phage-related endonuclease